MPNGTGDDAFADALRQIGGATYEQLEAARLTQTRKAQQGETVTLAEVLVQQGVITVPMRENVEKRLEAQADGIKQLGAYKLLKKLGEGGMGIVYLAEDTQMGRQCALKVLSAEYAASPEFLTRFRREAVATGKLNHPNIVMAYAVGEDRGVHFYAMEYCIGEPLDTLLEREGKVPWPVAVDIVLQVTRGLQHAHEHDIVHRDIKPGNIFICSPDGMERSDLPFPKGFVAKILDLGLSKMTRTGDEASFLTQTGTTLGTPHYIAPEQASGDKEIDGRADIYSLGATFYHLVTGKTPFPGTTAGALIMQHIRQPVPDPKDTDPAIPNGVASAIRRMMAKQPRDRYADCQELVTYLEWFTRTQMPAATQGMVGRPVSVSSATSPVQRPPAEAPATGLRLANYRPLAGAIAAVALIVAILLSVFGSGDPPEQSVAERNAEFMRQQRLERKEELLRKAEQAKRKAEERARIAEASAKRAEEKRKAAEAETAKALQRELELRQRLAMVSRAEGEKPQNNPNARKEEPGHSVEETSREGSEPDDQVLPAIERWAHRAFEDDFDVEPTVLAKATRVDDVAGLKRTHGLLTRRMSEVEEAHQKALDKEEILEKRIKALLRKPAFQVNTVTDARNKVQDFKRLQELESQHDWAKREADRMVRALEHLSFAKRIVESRLRTLGVEDLPATADTSKKEDPYKVYVMQDGTELKAYMAVKMGDQIAIKDEKGQMRTVKASDVKGIRDGP